MDVSEKSTKYCKVKQKQRLRALVIIEPTTNDRVVYGERGWPTWDDTRKAIGETLAGLSLTLQYTQSEAQGQRFHTHHGT
jgi:phage gp46-like protein